MTDEELMEQTRLDRIEFVKYIGDKNLGWKQEYQVTGLAVTTISEATIRKALPIILAEGERRERERSRRY